MTRSPSKKLPKCHATPSERDGFCPSPCHLRCTCTFDVSLNYENSANNVDSARALVTETPSDQAAHRFNVRSRLFVPAKRPMNYLLAQVGLLLDATACAAYRLEPTIDLLILESGWELPECFYTWRTIALELLPTIQTVLVKQQPIVLPSLARDTLETGERSPSRWRMLLESGCYTTLLVPLVADRNVYGALFLYYVDAYWFADEDFVLAMALGSKIARNIKNTYPVHSSTTQ